MKFDKSLDKCRRGNMGTFYLVFAACLLPIKYAAIFLAEAGVPFEVAHRVLLYPNRRRGMKCSY